MEVVYDERAVPHIFARTEDDAYRALGYVVARDRLFQLYIADARRERTAHRDRRRAGAEARSRDAPTSASRARPKR